MYFLYDAFLYICTRRRDFKKLTNVPLVPITEYGVWSLFPYHHLEIKEAILRVKTKRDLLVTLFFTKHLAEQIATKLHLDKSIWIVGIPARRERLRKYGFSQCELLATLIVYFLKKKGIYTKHKKILHIRNTSKQAFQKSKEKRMENLDNAFFIKKKLDFANVQIILIDDVMTTGATLHAAKKVLRDNGATTIDCFAIAH